MTVAGRVLTLREYQTAIVGDEWDPERRVITPGLASELERLQGETGQEIFALRRRKIQAQQYVGTVGIGPYTIDVLPKVDLDDAGTRANLMHMLGVAGLVPSGESGIAALAASSATVVDAFMGLYVRQLALEWRRGRIASYRKEDANRACLRGKLLFGAQLRENLFHPERFHTRADEFLHDVELPRLLKAALRICCRNAVSQQMRSQAFDLLAEFGQVQDVQLTESEIDRVTVDRRTARFGALVTLAKLLLSGRVPDRQGQGLTYSLVFDMNVVFEQYIGRLIRAVASSPTRTVRLQFSRRYLLRRGRQRKFRLRPDIAIREGDRLTCLIDTKWKRLDSRRPHEGVSSADMYQMYAYGKGYDCPTVILLYPQSDELERHVATYRHHPGDQSCPRIEVRTVDVRHPASSLSQSVSAQLRELLATPAG